MRSEDAKAFASKVSELECDISLVKGGAGDDLHILEPQGSGRLWSEDIQDPDSLHSWRCKVREVGSPRKPKMKKKKHNQVKDTDGPL